jgi:hypothetical protein
MGDVQVLSPIIDDRLELEETQRQLPHESEIRGPMTFLDAVVIFTKT